MPHTVTERLPENYAGMICAHWTPEMPTIFIKLVLVIENILKATKELARADLTSGLTSWAYNMHHHMGTHT